LRAAVYTIVPVVQYRHFLGDYTGRRYIEPLLFIHFMYLVWAMILDPRAADTKTNAAQTKQLTWPGPRQSELVFLQYCVALTVW
jgi:hypothetical protein